MLEKLVHTSGLMPRNQHYIAITCDLRAPVWWDERIYAR